MNIRSAQLSVMLVAAVFITAVPLPRPLQAPVKTRKLTIQMTGILQFCRRYTLAPNLKINSNESLAIIWNSDQYFVSPTWATRMGRTLKLISQPCDNIPPLPPGGDAGHLSVITWCVAPGHLNSFARWEERRSQAAPVTWQLSSSFLPHWRLT